MRAGAGQLNDAAELSRSVLALRAAGTSVRSFAGRDLLSELERRQRGDGSFQGQAPTTAFAIMALRAAGRSTGSGSVRRATGWLAAQQNSDGGFSNGARGGASDVDDAGAALQGLSAAGRGAGSQARRAVRFLSTAQNPDGGLGQFPDGRSNAQSSAWAAQGLVAAGRNPSRFRDGGSRSLIGYLSSLQQPDGSYRYSRTSAQTPVWVTAQVLTAVRRRAFPLARVPRRKTARATATAAGSDSAGEPNDGHVKREARTHKPTSRPAAKLSPGAQQPTAQAGELRPASAATGVGPGSDTRGGSQSSDDSLRFGLAGLAVVAALGAGYWLRRRPD
jgi:hypothetical protein